jgi:signal transduction histidine kinase
LAEIQARSGDTNSELRRQIEELRQSVRARDDFIAIAAHELRNPMTPVIGVAELALAAARKADGTCPLRVIELLERLQGLVQDYMKRATRLLDISRVEAGELRLAPAVTGLSSLVCSVAQRYEAEAAHRHCVLELYVEDGVTAVCDPLAVEQVIENLLSNALKFGAGKPVTLRLRSDASSAYLEVHDRVALVCRLTSKRAFSVGSSRLWPTTAVAALASVYGYPAA